MKALLKSLVPETSFVRLTYHRAKALLAALMYGFPAKNLLVIGVTGTDGKTTTVGMISHILNENGVKCGALSTAFFQYGNEINWNPTQKTSPSPFIIQKFLKRCVEERCTHAVLECSSHGLLQGRLNYIFPTVAAITNISHEHLDYHGTMERYLSAKTILFTMLRKKTGTKVLHYGDPSYTSLSYIPSKDTISFHKEAIDVDERFGPPMNLWLEDAEVTPFGSKGTLVWYPQKPRKIFRAPLQLRIPGAFNLENALCAIGCVKGLPDSLSMEKVLHALTTFPGVPGRMERIDMGQKFSVYIDFTVTPQSYESTLSTLRQSLQNSSAKLLVLTGSCGDRMKEKRPLVGKLCSEMADITVVTNEDPYTEDPEAIIDDVISGISSDKNLFLNEAAVPSSPPKKYCVRISDRLEAIRFLLHKAAPGDVVLFCGKGSDVTMMTAHGQIPWIERDIVKKELTSLLHGAA